jgi:YesN/AraC family two-component response regulator
MEKISLQDLAASVHLNPDYLSATFKKEVGINFSD